MTRLDQMTQIALDIFLEELGNKRMATNEEFFRGEFQAMRKVMEPIQMRIEELEDGVRRYADVVSALSKP